jgi:hypothetical protein
LIIRIQNGKLILIGADKMNIKKVELSYDLDQDIPSNYGEKLRGFFANKFNEILFHNHSENGNFRYGYPLIQYKVIKNRPVIIGINDGADLIVKYFLDIDNIQLGNKNFKNPTGNLKIENEELKIAENERYIYEFQSPWLGLNQNNYKKYMQLENKNEFLKSKLVGNILSFAKGINWWIDKKINIDDFEFVEFKVNYKNRNLQGFKGRFITNIKLPNNIGLGKSVSKGFGRIERNKYKDSVS